MFAAAITIAPPPPQKAIIIGVQPLLEYLHGKTANQFTSLLMPESSSPWKNLEVYGKGDLYRKEIQDQFNDRVIHKSINERKWKGVVIPGLLTTLRKFP
ncbi:hypothetical protein F4802DRAFT_603748 [Xylaria palmicola]|nr:hypothetical protein F4802DRAFT_603748 [Xylaria palmicola]